MKYLALLVLLAGCGSLTIAGATPESVTIMDNRLTGDSQDAFNAAQKHCQRYGKNARLSIDGKTLGGVQRLTFDCVKP